MSRNHFTGALARAALLTLALGLAATQARAYPGMGKKPAAAPQGHPAVSGARYAYDCPRPGCGFESSGPGTCPTHKLKLEKMTTMYTCPTDGQPVAGPGKCPRCPMDAKQHKLSAEERRAGGEEAGLEVAAGERHVGTSPGHIHSNARSSWIMRSRPHP